MTTFVFSNNAQANLAGALTNTATTVNLTAGSGALFPPLSSGQEFAITFVSASNTLIREIAYCTAISGDVLTVVRGQEGTTALPWYAGDFVYHWLTAGQMRAFSQSSSSSSSFYEGYDTSINGNVVNVPTLTPALSSPSAGQVFVITKGTVSNTGTTTMQIAGGAAYAIVYKDGSLLNAGDWPASSAAILIFNGSVYQLIACQKNAGAQSYYSGVDSSGTANTIAATVTPSLTSYAVGQIFLIETANANTGAVTININAVGARSLLSTAGNALIGGEFFAGQQLLVAPTAAGQFQLLSNAIVKHDASLSGNGQGTNLTLNIQSDGSISGAGSVASPAVLNVQHDTSISGNGSFASPLSVASPGVVSYTLSNTNYVAIPISGYVEFDIGAYISNILTLPSGAVVFSSFQNSSMITTSTLHAASAAGYNIGACNMVGNMIMDRMRSPYFTGMWANQIGAGLPGSENYGYGASPPGDSAWISDMQNSFGVYNQIESGIAGMQYTAQPGTSTNAAFYSGTYLIIGGYVYTSNAFTPLNGLIKLRVWPRGSW